MNNPLRYTDTSGEFWNVVFGYLFAAYVKGAYESGGQLNPFKWDNNAWTSVFAGAASTVVSPYASSYATSVTNNYLENYNNKPALEPSAIGPGYNFESFSNSQENNLEIGAIGGNLQKNDDSDFSKEFLALSVGTLSESKFEGRYYFKGTTNTFFDLGNVSKFGTYGLNILDGYTVFSGFYNIFQAKSHEEKIDATYSLGFDGLIIGAGRKWPLVGITVGIGKVVSTTEVYKQGMIDGRNKAFIQENGYPVNHTATIKPDSGMYRQCEICPLKFR
ncbi:hypothetical protein ABXT06_17045 [Flavobacterium sp. UW10123]|uniref:hypothetical protein n=1 Tax=Flavobacterium sp. UW10123 TaxID=3230800 RepID=UPI003394BADD